MGTHEPTMFNHNGPLYDFFEKKYIPVNTAENLLSALSHAKTVSNEHRRRPDSILGCGEVLGTHEPTRFNHNGPLYDILKKYIQVMQINGPKMRDIQTSGLSK